MTMVTIKLRWNNMEPFVMYRVYHGMRLWLEERNIKYQFEFLHSSYYPSAIIIEEQSAAAFKLIF